MKIERKNIILVALRTLNIHTGRPERDVSGKNLTDAFPAELHRLEGGNGEQAIEAFATSRRAALFLFGCDVQPIGPGIQKSPESGLTVTS